jgi:hypothetical protein
MSLESTIVAALQAAVPGAGVHPLLAPDALALPSVLWQPIGGRSLVPISGQVPAERHLRVQTSVHAATMAQALQMRDAIEAALLGLPHPVTCRPESEPYATAEAQLGIYILQQDWTITGPR